MSQDNTKKNRIRRTQRKAKKNKLEDHLRTVKSRLNKKSVVDTKATSSLTNFVSNVNSDLKCASCNGCLFFDNHDACVVAYINSVNASIKSKSVKTPVKRKVWQPTGNVFKTVGHIWKPTGRTFILVGNVCLLTRIATTTIVPHGEPIPIVNSTDKPVVTLVYSRKTKAANKKVHVSNFRITKSLVANKMEPNNSWGSSSSNVPSPLIDCRLSKSSFESVNEKKYILVIVDDYSRFTWVKFLRSKDETLDFIIKFLKMIQVRLKVPVHHIRTDNGTEFVNQTLRDYYEEVGISHETSVARSPQQNEVVERCNHTLIEAARTMLIYAQAPLFLWAEAVATACFTQNRSIIRLRHGKTPYELMHSKLPDLSFFHVFGALCYPTNDNENLGKLQQKADIRIFIGYAPTKKAFRIYNRRTRRIVETIHVDFDELIAMAYEQSSSRPALNEMTPGTIISGLVQTYSPSTSYVPPSRNDWDLMFQPILMNYSIHHQVLLIKLLKLLLPLLK
nr:retrovirus-related Pol polyprotein from transposon TNT 1-94 [Tanacetum cinerariifolium]